MPCAADSSGFLAKPAGRPQLARPTGNYFSTTRKLVTYGANSLACARKRAPLPRSISLSRTTRTTRIKIAVLNGTIIQYSVQPPKFIHAVPFSFINSCHLCHSWFNCFGVSDRLFYPKHDAQACALTRRATGGFATGESGGPASSREAFCL